MASFHSPLDVLRIVIAAPYDDEILPAAGDKELVGWINPRSPVRRKGPLPLSASLARKVCSESSG